MWDFFVEGMNLALRWDTFAIMSVGLMLGMFVGALPGFTTVMAMAILLPLSFFVEPLIGIPFLLGVYKGGIYGGSIPAILVSMPGTGASVATTFDGPALTKKRQARKALEIALFSSVFGDLSSDIVTILFIGPIALIALMMGPPELAAVLVLALIVIAATSSGVFVKGLLMLVTGLLFSLIGQDPIGALSRFTFDVFAIRAGVPLLPMLIGVYALPEILTAIEKRAAGVIRQRISSKEGGKLTFEEFRGCFRTICRSTVIGTSIGMIPGVGQVAAAFMGYAAAKNASDTPEEFGKGKLEGVAAAEAANNAVNGPTMVPLLTLGIPGDNITAILIGAFIAQGLSPGPTLIPENPEIIYSLFMSMFIATCIMFAAAMATVKIWVKVLKIPQRILYPIVVVLSVAGSYAINSSMFDVGTMFMFGFMGYVMRKMDFPIPPVMLAFVLTPMLEPHLRQALLISKGSVMIFITHPISAAFLILTVGVVLQVVIREMVQRRKEKGKGESPAFP